MWPFHPETQPEALVNEYNDFCKRINPKPQEPSQKADIENPTINGVLNPFAK